MEIDNFIILQASLCVSIIYSWAGLGKLVAPTRAANFISQLEFASPFNLFLTTRLIGVFEIFVALNVMLATGILRTISLLAVIASSLLFIFISARVIKNRQILACGCFGDDRRIGLGTVWLNAFVALLSLLLLSLTRETESSLSLFLYIDLPAATLLGIVVANLVIYLWPRVRSGIISQTASGKETVYPAEAVSPFGQTLTLSELYRGEPVLLVFAKHSCLECQPILRFLQIYAEKHSIPRNLYVITRTSGQEIHDQYPLILNNVLFGPSAITASLGVAMAPATVIVGINSLILEGPVYGGDSVLSTIKKFLSND